MAKTIKNNINLKNLNKMNKIACNVIIVLLILLAVYFILFNNLSISSITSFLFNYDLGRIVLIVLLVGISSQNLFLGILFFLLIIFLYEYKHFNISKYNDYESNISDKKNITVQDILNLEGNISSKPSNKEFQLGFNLNNNNLSINPSYEGMFNNNYASAF